MAIIESQSPIQMDEKVSHRRSFSVSPTEESSEPRPNKRRRVSRFFRQDSQPTNDDDDDHLLRSPRHRKSSGFLTMFNLPKVARKLSTHDKMPTTNSGAEGEHRNEAPLAQRSVPYDTFAEPIEPERRRSSLAKIKEFFTRKRKDSGVQESTVPDHAAPYGEHPIASNSADAHHQTEVQYFNASLEPLAMGTSRRCYHSQPANLKAVSPSSLL
jgi:hypothetical protein